MICQLTGMDVANASMYDGSTAVPEAAMMAVAHHRPRPRAGRAAACIPEYREVLRDLRAAPGHAGRRVRLRSRDRAGWIWKTWSARSTTHTAAVIIQSPNFFGIVEDVKAAAEIAHKHGALLVVVVHRSRFAGLAGAAARRPTSWPANCSPSRISPSYGGPYAGIIATKEKFIRQMPGRLVGETTDSRRQPRLLPDALHARAAHPPREGDLQHLHQPGADRPDGDRLHDGLRQAGPARTGRTEPGQGALPGRQD